MGRLRLRGASGLMAALCLFGATAAQAQNPRSQSTVPTPQQLNPAELAQTQARQRSNDIFVAPDPGPCPLRGSTLTLQLASVTFTGAAGVKSEDLAQSYAGL